MACLITNLVTWLVLAICMIMWLGGSWLFKYDSALIDAVVARPIKKVVFKPITKFPLTGRQRSLLATAIAQWDTSNSMSVDLDGMSIRVERGSGDIDDVRFESADKAGKIDPAEIDRLMVKKAQKRLANLQYLLDELADGDLIPDDVKKTLK